MGSAFLNTRCACFGDHTRIGNADNEKIDLGNADNEKIDLRNADNGNIHLEMFHLPKATCCGYGREFSTSEPLIFTDSKSHSECTEEKNELIVKTSHLKKPSANVNETCGSSELVAAASNVDHGWLGFMFPLMP